MIFQKLMHHHNQQIRKRKCLWKSRHIACERQYHWVRRMNACNEKQLPHGKSDHGIDRKLPTGRLNQYLINSRGVNKQGKTQVLLLTKLYCKHVATAQFNCNRVTPANVRPTSFFPSINHRKRKWKADSTHTSPESPSPILELVIPRWTRLSFRAVMGMSKLLGFDDFPIPLVPRLRAKVMLNSKVWRRKQLILIATSASIRILYKGIANKA